MIGESTKVGERANIKRSVIGKHCIIGRSVKISGCVLLDHCIVADGYRPFPTDLVILLSIYRSAKLDGSVLGVRTKVGAKAELVRCVTQAAYEVDPGGEYEADVE